MPIGPGYGIRIGIDGYRYASCRSLAGSPPIVVERHERGRKSRDGFRAKFDIKSFYTDDEIREVLGRTVNISHIGVVMRLIDEGRIPKEWERNALLSDIYIVTFKMDCGKWIHHLDGYDIIFDQELGLKFERGESYGA